jgi:hypothetical protein
MEKIAFALDTDDGWPPVAIEHVWCENAGSIYQLKNAPFFIKGLAFDDKFSAETDSVNGCVFEFTVVESSGHSLVWIIDQGGLKLGEYEDALLSLGLGVEGFPRFNLHAVDVPASVDCEAVNTLMDRLESLGFAMAFPVWRH